jgi:hypothetical protein
MSWKPIDRMRRTLNIAAVGAIVSRGGSEADARSYLAQCYQHVPVLSCIGR